MLKRSLILCGAMMLAAGCSSTPERGYSTSEWREPAPLRAQVWFGDDALGTPGPGQLDADIQKPADVYASVED